MPVVAPDFTRRVTLPGVGPCPRPVDLDQAATGLSQLVSLRIYSFADGMVIDGEAEADEVFITLMRGAAEITVTSAERRDDAVLRHDAGARVLYMPPHAAYRLQARGDCDVAHARVRPSGAALPTASAFAPAGGRIAIAGYATAMDLTLAPLATGETVTAGDGREYFMHVRSNDGGAAVGDGARLGDWATLVLASNERVAMTIEGGTVDLLSISATTG